MKYEHDLTSHEGLFALLCLEVLNAYQIPVLTAMAADCALSDILKKNVDRALALAHIDSVLPGMDLLTKKPEDLFDMADALLAKGKACNEEIKFLVEDDYVIDPSKMVELT